MFCHNNFEDNTEFYCVVRWCRVEAEGAEEHFFPTTQAPAPLNAEAREAEEDVEQELGDDTLHLGNRAEDIAVVRGQGLMVDDDNDPAPENVPEEPAVQGIGEEQSWGWDGTCKRKCTGAVNHGARITNLTGVALETVTYV